MGRLRLLLYTDQRVKYIHCAFCHNGESAIGGVKTSKDGNHIKGNNLEVILFM